MLQFVYKDVENVLKLASNTGHPCQVQPLELFFRGTYTWCMIPLLVLCVHGLHSCSTWNHINLSTFACWKERKCGFHSSLDACMTEGTSQLNRILRRHLSTHYTPDTGKDFCIM